MQPALPSGTVTFMFTDVEGSTKLLHALGPEGYAAALAEHRRIMRDAFAARGGVEVDTQGDAFFIAFSSASGALEAARAITEGLAAGPIQVRMGLHTGTPLLTGEGYVGSDVHRGARIAAAGHGGQVLLSPETVALVGSAGLSDLGEHRLKDFDEPIPIFQLGEERFPPLKTISNTNLPHPASSFVGREHEVEHVTGLLRDGARLLTLTGPGGTGKTRLAIETAAALVTEFKAGVFWVDLAALRDPALVPETIGQVLGAKEGVADHVGQREMLLLLDNLEQVVAAAPGLAALVEACPHLRLLVTSRERLRVRGEVEFPVAPLANPDAVALFCARAQAEPDEAVHQLCLALDNLPLALELAAARASVLSPAQILERLSGRLDLLKGGRDADPRQQTLRATIAWSHELLSAEDQRLFARLAVFRGGWTLEAAEQVVGADLDGLQSLVDKSLVRHGDDRFWMLETIREFAAERLEASSQADARRKGHADYFLTLAEKAEAEGMGDPAWNEQVEEERDNFRAALDRSEASGDLALALRLASGLVTLWETGHVAEGRQRIEHLLSRSPQPTLARAKGLAAAGLLARQSGDPAKARHQAGEAIALFRELGHAQGAANATLTLGLALADQGDFAGARELFEAGIQLFRDVGDDLNALFASRLLAWMHDELGDRERAWALYDHNLNWARKLGNKALEGQTLGAVAGMALDQGRTDDAVALLREVLRIDRGLGATLQTTMDLTRYARALAIAGGKDAEATALLSSADAQRHEMGAGGMPYLTKIHEEGVALIRTHLDEVAMADAWRRGAKLSSDEAVALALGEVGTGP